MKNLNYIIMLLFLLFLGCSEKHTDGVSEVHWDRDMCSRCVMVVSDRHNTVQVKDSNGKVYMFDDIGCMVLWFEEEHPELKDKSKIYITNVKDGSWIDAREAFYTTSNVTPMAFGFSAYKSKNNTPKNEEVIDYNEVYKRIIKPKK
ncbi:MAG: nitrous oxide reductase accessory protein NosL [Thiovulaceae bacterium]|nr:nitrous oxide reductase accessory protein NosL [Sulfurimonadaceae bacterium]